MEVRVVPPAQAEAWVRSGIWTSPRELCLRDAVEIGEAEPEMMETENSDNDGGREEERNHELSVSVHSDTRHHDSCSPYTPSTPAALCGRYHRPHLTNKETGLDSEMVSDVRDHQARK